MARQLAVVNGTGCAAVTLLQAAGRCNRQLRVCVQTLLAQQHLGRQVQLSQHRAMSAASSWPVFKVTRMLTYNSDSTAALE
jgi:hypothetical protein